MTDRPEHDEPATSHGHPGRLCQIGTVNGQFVTCTQSWTNLEPTGLPGHFPGCPRYDRADPFAVDWCDCAQARAEREVPPVPPADKHAHTSAEPCGQHCPLPAPADRHGQSSISLDDAARALDIDPESITPVDSEQFRSWQEPVVESEHAAKEGPADSMTPDQQALALFWAHVNPRPPRRYPNAQQHSNTNPPNSEEQQQ